MQASAVVPEGGRRRRRQRERLKSAWYYNIYHHCFKYGKYNWVGRGITDKIKQTFFPDDWDLYKVAGRNGNGTEGGKRVDQELGEWTRLVQLESKPSTIRAHMEKWSPSTLKIIDLFRQKKWIPVDTQVVVGCTVSRIATAIDIVARHFETNRLILIELKTGYDGTFVEYNGHSMLAPFSHLAATPRHFAWLQLTWSWMLWATTFPRRRVRHSDVMVLHVVEGREPTLHAIPPEFGLVAVDALRSLMTRSTASSSSSSQKRTGRRLVSRR